jgi:hypothetical protein
MASSRLSLASNHLHVKLAYRMMRGLKEYVPGGFWKEHDAAHDESWDEALYHSWEPPRPRVCEVLVGTVGCPASEDVAQPPEVVVHASHCASVGRMGQLDGVGRSSSRGDRGAKPKEETPTDEMTHAMCSGLNSSSNQNERTADKDTHAATIAVSEEAAKRESCDLPQVVDDEDYTGAGTLSCQTKGGLVWLHGINGAHERGVKTVHGGYKVPNTHDHVQLDHVLGPQLGLLGLKSSSCSMLVVFAMRYMHDAYQVPPKQQSSPEHRHPCACRRRQR